MKTIRHSATGKNRSTGILAAIAAAAALASSLAFAHAPVINIVSPTDASAVQHSAYPAMQSVQLDITHLELQDLSNVKVIYTPSVGLPVSIVEFGNPFPGNLCNTSTIALPTTCAITTPASAARITAQWQIPAPGVYTLTVETRHGGSGGAVVVSDSETITAETTVVAEYPALPAVVNAYIQARTPSMPGKIKGCLVSGVAKVHEAYYPKNVYAPYTNATVRTALANFYDVCSAGAYAPALMAAP
jgi:hypothetical protein